MLRISWSQIRTHSECHQKSYLYRKGKRPSLADQRNFFPGTVTDRVVRHWLDDKSREPNQMPGMVRTVITEELERIRDDGGVVLFKNTTDLEKIQEDCIEAVTKIEPHLRKWVTPFRFKADVRFDAPFRVPNALDESEYVFLIGYMDILVLDNKDQFWVHDVKHTKNTSYWKKTLGQLDFYDLALFSMYGKHTAGTTLMQPLCKKELFPHKVTEENSRAIAKRVVDYAQDIWSNEKTPVEKKSGVCAYCDVKASCAVFKAKERNGKHYISLSER